MFTSNGEFYCSSKRGEPGLISGLRALAPEIHHTRYNHHPDLVAGKKQQHREFFEDDERKLHFRHGRRYTSFDDESSVSSYVPELKTPPGYLRTTTTPEFKTPPGFTPPLAKHQSHGNQLLNLRAALNEKELQLVELREQHITILNRAADARQNWEEALKSKDNVILQLQRTLQHKKVQLDRQERQNQENLHALRKRQKEEDTAVEKKELTVALLKAKNAQFVAEVVEQQKLITRMKRHIDENVKLGAGQHQKLEMMNGRVQDLKAALQEQEEEAEMQSKYCNELKTLLWKRDSMIAQLQLSEQQLQSNLAREVAAREAVLVCRDKLQEEKTLLEKRLSELQSHHKATGNSGPRSGHHKGNSESEIRKLMELKDGFSNVQEGAFKDLDDREGVMHRIQKRMRELQRSLRSKDNALSDKNNELQQARHEIQRVTEEYEALKQEVDEVNKRNEELETALAQLQDYADARTAEASVSEAPVEVLPYEYSLGGSTGEDHGGDDALLECVESLEQLSNASVYHANFEKVKIVEVEIINTDPQQLQQEQQEQQKNQQKKKQLKQQEQQQHHHQQQQQQQQQHHQQRQQEEQQKQKQEQEQQKQQKQQQKKKASVPVAQTPHLPSKIKPPKNFTSSPPAATSPVARPSSPPSDLLHYQELDANYNSIQDEIMKREQCWRKTEELMRAALTRRMKLLEEANEAHSSETNATWPAKSGLKLHDKRGYLRNYQEEISGRGSKSAGVVEQESKKNQTSNGASDGQQQKSFEQDSGKARTNPMEYSQYYERNNGRSGRAPKGRFL